MSRRPSLRRLLRRRDLRLLLLGQAASTLGNAFSGIAIAFAVLQTTGSVADVGLALAAFRAPLLVFGLVGGVVGDRWSRRAVLLASDVGRLVTQALAAGLLLTGRARLWELLVLFALHGLGQAFFNPAMVGFVPALVAADELQEANAALGLARNGSATVGALLGGAVVTLVGPGAAFAMDAGSFLISAVALAALRPADRAVPVAATRSLVTDLRDGWDEFCSHRWLWIGTVHVALLNTFALVAFFALGPVVAARSLGGGIAWGFVGSAFMLGMITGSGTALRIRPRRPLLVAFAVIAFAAPQLALLALAAPVPLVAAGAFLGGAQAALWGALWTTTMQRAIPPNAIARVAAYSQVGSLVLGPVGYAGVGYVASRVGVSETLWAGAGWIVASTALVLALPTLRRYRSAVPEPASAAALGSGV